MAAIREVVDDYQREADKGIGSAGRLSHPDETIARLGAQPARGRAVDEVLQQPGVRRRAVACSGDVITAIGRDGRLSVDPEPTCEAEMTAIVARLLAEAGATVDSGAHDRRASDLGQPGAGVGVDPTDGVEVWTARSGSTASSAPPSPISSSGARSPRRRRTSCTALAIGQDPHAGRRRAGLGQVDVHGGARSRRRRRRRTCGSARSTGS